MQEYGKLDFSVSFNPTSAFPLDARCEFNTYEEALAAAQDAGEVGNKISKYYYGMIFTVHGDSVQKYVVQTDGTLELLGSGAGGGDVEWEAVKNKPFTRYVGAVSGHLVTAPEVSFEFMGISWYQVTSQAPSNEQLVGAKLSLTIGGTEIYNGVVTADMLQSMGDAATAINLSGLSLAVVRQAGSIEGEIGGEVVTIDVPAVGVYMPADSTEWAEVNICISWEYEQLKAECLPMDAIDARIDAYITEALGGDY